MIETLPSDVNWYGRREGHFVTRDGLFAPVAAPAGQQYVYLCVFADRMKVGISVNPAGRISQHQRTAGQKIDHCYFILLEREEARRRENVLVRAFGQLTCERGGRSEWFGREDLPAAVLLLRNPEMLEAYRILRQQRLDFERDAFDRRFAPFSFLDPKTEAA